MKLRIALEDKQMDVRLRDRFVAEGKTTTKDVENYLKSLADEEGNYERVTNEKANTEASAE